VRFAERPAQRKVSFSTARLAAEAAFAAEPEPLPASPIDKPFVRVLQAKIPASKGASAESEPQDVVAAGRKTPRVFRIGETRPRESPALAQAESPRTPRRRAKTNETTRPGPVLQIAHASAADLRKPPAGTALLGQGGIDGLRSLQRTLEALEPVFGDIAFAQAFSIQEHGADLAWRRIEDAVTALATRVRLALANQASLGASKMRRARESRNAAFIGSDGLRPPRRTT